eukprot:m.108401 g.108401  ORF g.108401 m.108401 type:complete len:152 (-) comp13345_c3_seq3:188-643(-)
MASTSSLNSLQSIDATITTILCQISSTALYPFDTQRNCWGAVTGQGPLFLVQRRAHEPLCLIQLNQKHPTNFEMDLAPGIMWDKQDTCILFQRTDDPYAPSFCIWAADVLERDDMLEHLVQYVTLHCIVFTCSIRMRLCGKILRLASCALC